MYSAFADHVHIMCMFMTIYAIGLFWQTVKKMVFHYKLVIFNNDFAS